MIKQYTLVTASLLLAACGGMSADDPSAEAKALVAAVAEVEDPPPEPEVLSAAQQAMTNAKINITTLTAYRDFAEGYKSDIGSYPPTKRNFRSAVGAFEDAAEATMPEGERVDLGLPEGVKLSQYGAIVYRSDGTDYKLIAQRTGDCSVVRESHPDLVDPKRDYGPGDCIAYGYWTSGAETW